ncbi:hypothetical protein [Staphylococcus epidermidis]
MEKLEYEEGVGIEEYIYFLIGWVKYEYVRKVKGNYKGQGVVVNE